jgi:hypothetical protein
MTATNLADQYDLPPIDLSAVRNQLDRGFDQAPGGGGPNRHTCWLTTINADGGPHVTGIGALWADGAFWFETGAETRKGRNLARDPRCVLAVALTEYDVVAEGTAAPVLDPALVAARAAEWAAGGWPCEVDASGTALTAPFSAPSAGPPPWLVYRIDGTELTALMTVEPGGATRWTL